MRRFVLPAVVIAIALPLFAAEPNPSLRQRELIEKMLAATNSDRMMTTVMDSMYAEIEKQFMKDAHAKGNDPEDIAEAQELFTMFRERSRKADLGALFHESIIRINAKYFSEQELADLVAFYASPTGKKAVSVMPQLMAEGMRAGVDTLQPKVEEIMAGVLEEQEHKRPWRRTMADMRALATGVEAYQTDQSDESYPAAADLTGLKTALKGITMSQKFPEKDMWGHPYAYVVSPDHHHYRIVSAGADGIFDWDSRKIDAAKSGDETTVRYRDRLEDDIIYEDGSFLQLPVQAKPKAKKE